MKFKHMVVPENVAKFRDWLQNRGGLAIWRSCNLSNPGASWTTPALTAEGNPFPKPTWEAEEKPEMIITSESDVGVSVDKEVKRFHVAVRPGRSGLLFKLTDASSRKIRAAVEKAGEGSYHVFDYGSQEAVIMQPEKVVPLSDWSE